MSRGVEFAGTTAVVTGGASGIGKGMARAFRAAGAHVVIADRALAEHGEVHVICNNADVGPFGSMTPADWRWVLDVNLNGVLYGTQAFLPLLERNPDWGHVVNTSSMSVMLAPAHTGAYVASKAAVLGLTEVLATELAAAGSRVGTTALIPGTVRTNIGHSLRTRPGTEPSGLYEVDLAATARDFRWLDPDEVGAMVLDAIRVNQLYLLTHPEFAEAISARHERINAGGRAKGVPRELRGPR